MFLETLGVRVCTYVFRGHNVGWIMVKQKCQEDSILEAVAEGCQGHLETLQWVSAALPHGYQAHQQPPHSGAPLCSSRPYLPALPLWVRDPPPQRRSSSQLTASGASRGPNHSDRRCWDPQPGSGQPARLPVSDLQ